MPPPSDVEVRAARQDDVEAMVSLLGLLFEGEDEFSVEPASQRLGLLALMAAPARARVVLAERAGQVLGMVTVQVVISTATGGSAAILEDMVVAPPARGTGVGSLLLGAALEAAEHLGCRRITLLTDGDNVEAHRFYRRHGFERSTMIPMRRGLDGVPPAGRTGP